MAEVTASVVVCVYNRAGQVGACLDSLLRLEFQDFEIVLVDDGSADDTPRVLEEFRLAHPGGAVVVRNERNLGLSAARNVGIRAARGRLVFFTDSDCVVEPGWLGAMVRAFDRPEVSAAAGRVLDAEPRNLAERAYVGTTRLGGGTAQGRGLVGNNMGFRREVVADLLFDEALTYYADDDDLARRLLAEGRRIAFVPEAVVRHDHPTDFGKYLRTALRQGQGSARYWYKHGVYVGRDLLFLVAALATLPLGFFDIRLLAVPAFCLTLQAAALVYAEVAFKGKSLATALAVLPLNLLYSLCKAWGVARTHLHILLGREKAVIDSKRRWRERLRAAR